MLGFQNTKKFLLKNAVKLDQKKFLLLVKLKTQFRGHTRLVIRMVNQSLDVFMKKNCKLVAKKNLEYQK